jgi:protein-S-isoprenylcysteine O-methyltransferase Ste14
MMIRSLELKIPPPAVALAFAALMWMLAHATPYVSSPAAGRAVVAVILAVAGVSISLTAMISFRHARTTVNPMRPGSASTLVTGGIYRYTRNPMYLGLLIVLLGWAVWLANAPALVFLPGFVLYIYCFQIAPEERTLAKLFGAEYQAYLASVRRWL